jgi:hypothetical protein
LKKVALHKRNKSDRRGRNCILSPRQGQTKSQSVVENKQITSREGHREIEETVGLARGEATLCNQNLGHYSTQADIFYAL